MLTLRQIRALSSRISTRDLRETADFLATFDRHPDGPQLHELCEQLAVRLDSAGAGELQLKTYAIGPHHRYLGWTCDRHPFTEHAELTLLDADGNESLLCKSSEHPGRLLGSLRSTDPVGEVFEIVDVGCGTRPSDYRGRRVTDRLALAWGPQRQSVLLEAVGVRGAAGVLFGPLSGEPPQPFSGRSALGSPAWYDGRRPFAFQLTDGQFRRLLGQLARAEDVHARVNIRATTGSSGVLPVLYARLPGAELAEQRVLLVCDISNAESTLAAACLHQALAAISAAVVAADLPPLRRSIELLFAPGVTGAVCCLADDHDLSTVRAALQLSAGAAPRPADCWLYEPPPTLPSFLPDVVESHLDALGKQMIVQRTAPPAGAPTFVLTDSDIAIPAVWLLAGEQALLRGSAHDSRSESCARRVREDNLAALVSAVAASAVDLASIDDDDLPRLISAEQIRATARLADRAAGLQGRLRAKAEQAEGKSAAVRHQLWIAETSMREALSAEMAALQSTGEFLRGAGSEAVRIASAGADLERTAAALCRSLAADLKSTASSSRARLSPRRRPQTAVERRAQKIVVKRLFQGPPALPMLLREATDPDRRWLADNEEALSDQPPAEALLRWIDDERTLLAIVDRLSIEDPRADLRLLWRFLEVLEGAGLVKLETTPEVVPAVT